VGLFGALSGLVAGLTVLKYRNELRLFLAQNFNLEIFPANVYGLPSLPAHVRNADLYWICIPAFILCGIAALLPALFSFRDDPAKALRGER
jgi:lipoprotein-releasing system permease protein